MVRTSSFLSIALVLSTFGCSSPSSSEETVVQGSALQGSADALPVLKGYYVDESPRTFEFRTGADDDTAVERPFEAIEFSPGGVYTVNASRGKRGALAGLTKDQGKWSVEAREGQDGYPFALVLRPKTGGERKLPLVAFPDGTFQLKQPGGVSVFFPSTSFTGEIPQKALEWLQACDQPCPDQGTTTSCEPAPLSDAGCTASLCAPVRTCGPASTAP